MMKLICVSEGVDQAGKAGPTRTPCGSVRFIHPGVPSMCLRISAIALLDLFLMLYWGLKQMEVPEARLVERKANS